MHVILAIIAAAVVLIVIREAVKLGAPRKAGPAIDRTFDNGVRVVGKIALFAFLISIAALIAGVYGAFDGWN